MQTLISKEGWIRYLILLIAILSFNCSYAQSYERKGNNFVAVSTRASKSEATKTSFTFTDSKGKIYPIFVTKNGRCFVNKISSKTGKEYKYYLKEELAREICKELNIEYKTK